MSIARVTTWASGNTLTASALNGEFDNIINNALALISPLTGNLNFNGNLLQNLSAGSVSAPGLSFNNDSNTGIYASAADTVDITSGGIRSASFATVASGVNYLSFAPGITGTPGTAFINAAGSDTDVNIRLVGKGAGIVDIAAGTVTTPGLSITGDLNTGIYHSAADTMDIAAGGVRSARFNTATTGVNFADITPAAASSGPIVAAAGSDTDITLRLNGKGLNGVLFNTNSGTPAANNAYQASIAKGWIKFNGTGTIAIIGSYNVTSITDDGTGTYTITWDRDFADTTYVCVGTTKGVDDANANVEVLGFHTYAAGSVKVFVSDRGSDAAVDAALITAVAYGAQ